ncbi:unnamed protein product [Allacma fusca]|uniref:Uncharacterized protein n=1 Tax=Allacma fusca TaxID=39272 RepID=A0A8J2KRD5_9HEXA|nr:unnamed protein product [Allacma fusca]
MVRSISSPKPDKVCVLQLDAGNINDIPSEILLSHLEKISGDMDAIIKEQIHWLVSKTTSVPEFGLILVQNGQLNRDSFERIKKEYRFDNDQSQEIYRVVAKCGNWKALIHAWNGSNNQHIIRDLPTRLQIRRDNVAAESGNANPEIRIQEQAIKIPNDPENPPGDEGDITSNINTSYPITRRSKQEVCLTHLIHNKRSLQLLIICLWILAAMAITTLVVTCAFLAKNLIHTQSNIFSTPHVNDANQSSLSRGNHSTGSPDTFENSTQLDWKYSTPDGVTTENTFPSISTVGGDNYENWTSAYTEIVNVIYSDSSMNKFKNPIKIIEIADPLRILPATKGGNTLDIRDKMFDFNNIMPDKCISSNPDKKSLIVFCPGLL